MNASRNVTRLGDETRHRGLCIPDTEPSTEPWCSSLSECPLLRDFGIRHMGIVDASTDYFFERIHPLQPLFLASLGGTGHISTGPAASQLPVGQGALLPRGCHRMYCNASTSQSWQFVWICFDDPSSSFPGLEGGSFSLNAAAFQHTVEALITCWDTYRCNAVSSGLISGLIDLVKLHLGIRPGMESFHKAWQTVSADLAAEWSVSSIASLCASSLERFRRLCWSELGASPMKHLSKLRLNHARMMLSSSPLTIEEISVRLGYADAYSLSHAFKRSFGVCPSTYKKMLFAE